ncbi:MAG: NADH-quinone oxidoreductase subunit NuoF, partial [Salinisphaera sp.]|nr:NADH-quinone oxidoreductase subunit NuoF [Salinisphaera sp.]
MPKVLTRNITPDRVPPTRKEYEAAGGYQALRKALKDLSPADVKDLVRRSGLRGRGGAGFSTGMKWGFMPTFDASSEQERPPHVYLVANADEMEPGTFKDRWLMEGDPHQFIEALTLSSYAIGADICYVFIRGEYVTSQKALNRAIAEATQAGLLGDNILGTDYGLRIHLHMSAGRYICGEETALLSALEGKRAVPRSKPPFPAVSGLFGRPTTVNNVETLCNVPHIVANGPEWFKDLGLHKDGGTKIYGASGHVDHPGLVELPMGVPMGQLIDEHFGGIRGGKQMKAVQPGGGSTPFLTAEHWDVPLDYEGVAAVGSRLGTATLIVMDEDTPIVGVLRNLEHFYAQESCGWCTPCRDGLPWVENMLIDLEEGRGKPGDIELLDLHAKLLG